MNFLSRYDNLELFILLVFCALTLAGFVVMFTLSFTKKSQQEDRVKGEHPMLPKWFKKSDK